MNRILAFCEINLHRLIIEKASGVTKIKHSRREWNTFPGYAVDISKNSAEVIIVSEGYSARIQFRRDFLEDKDDGVSGNASFFRFMSICKKFGVALEDYYLPSAEVGYEVKQTIPRPYIDCDPLFICPSEEYGGIPAHHIDLHSAHMSGMALAYPDLYKPIEWIYTHRKGNPENKSILTHTWGYCQSQYAPVNYRLSHLSLAGIEFTNSKIEDLTKRLKDSGRAVIAHNTDGIWYAGDVYHGEGEGTTLGTWSNDHIECLLRFRSKGCYEYLEEGKYHAVVRGRTSLDSVKPRSEWQWGDIFRCGESISRFSYDFKSNRIIEMEESIL